MEELSIQVSSLKTSVDHIAKAIDELKKSHETIVATLSKLDAMNEKFRANDDSHRMIWESIHSLEKLVRDEIKSLSAFRRDQCMDCIDRLSSIERFVEGRAEPFFDMVDSLEDNHGIDLKSIMMWVASVRKNITGVVKPLVVWFIIAVTGFMLFMYATHYPFSKSDKSKPQITTTE